MVDPTTFTIARVLIPFFLASLKAARESAVSPDWLIMMQSAFLLRGIVLYLNSEASSHLTGMPASCSMMYCVQHPT